MKYFTHKIYCCNWHFSRFLVHSFVSCVELLYVVALSYFFSIEGPSILVLKDCNLHIKYFVSCFIEMFSSCFRNFSVPDLPPVLVESDEMIEVLVNRILLFQIINFKD